MRTVVCVCAVLLWSVCPVNATVDYTQPLTADAQTIGLWNMDSISSNTVAGAIAGTDLNLLTGATRAAGGGAIVAGPTAALGNALRLVGDAGWYDDAGTHESAEKAMWQGQQTVKVEGWVNFDNIAKGYGQYVVGNQNAFQVFAAGDGWMSFRTFKDYGNDVLTDTWVNTSAYSGQWLHFTGIYDALGHSTFNVVSLDGTLNVTAAADMAAPGLDTYDWGKFSTIVVGGEAGYRRFMTGAVDDIRISTVPEPATCVLLGLGAMLLRRKKA